MLCFGGFKFLKGFGVKINRLLVLSKGYCSSFDYRTGLRRILNFKKDFPLRIRVPPFAVLSETFSADIRTMFVGCKGRH